MVLTLPLAGALKTSFPECRVVFLGRTYTREVIALSAHVDEFVNYDELRAMSAWRRRASFRAFRADIVLHLFPRLSLARLAFFAGVQHRVGTRSRWYHWPFCNHLIRLPRRRSQLHEAQLNLQMLKFLNVKSWFALNEIPALYGFTKPTFLPEQFAGLLDRARANVILHPLSKGSAAEWGLANFSALIKALPESRFKIFISGTKEDGARLREFTAAHPSAVDLTGKLTLSEFIAFIRHADALVAASTGPLHIAAAMGITAVGLYSQRRPIFPKRWAPLGPRAFALVSEAPCAECRKGHACDCVKQISPSRVAQILEDENAA